MSAFEEKHLPRLLELVYASALDPAGWPVFLDALPKIFGGASGIFYMFDRELGCPRWTSLFNIDPDFQRSYAHHYAAINPYPLPTMQKNPAGNLVLATNSVTIAEIETTEFYNDWMRPQRVPADHFGATLFNNGEQIVILGVAPDHNLYERHRQRYERQLAILIPHLVRAVEINQRLEVGRTHAAVASAALEAFTRAAILVDGAGRPLLLNRVASDLLAARDGPLTVNAFGSLASCDPRLDLKAAVRRVVVTREATGPLTARAHARAGGHSVWVLPVPGDSSALLRAISDHAVAGRARPAALVLAAPADVALVFSPEIIAGEFELTAAEARLVAALVAGRSMADLARDTGHSRNTLRNQLASVFVKTGTHRQTELVALVVGRLGRGRR